MKRKFWNWIKNQDENGVETRTLFLNGEISDETWFGDEVTPGIFREELNAGSGPINIWINSPGGDVFAAAQIYNMLMDYPADVTVIIDSLAASAASVIAMAGTTVKISPTGMLMVHNPSTIAIGDSEEMKKAIKMLDEVKEAIMNAYEIKTGMGRDKISRLMDAETWLNAKKAVEMGFADEILFTGETANSIDSIAVSDELDMPVLFSRQAVMNSMWSKLIPPKKAEAAAEGNLAKTGTPVEQLEKRLSLLAH